MWQLHAKRCSINSTLVDLIATQRETLGERKFSLPWRSFFINFAHFQFFRNFLKSGFQGRGERKFSRFVKSEKDLNFRRVLMPENGFFNFFPMGNFLFQSILDLQFPVSWNSSFILQSISYKLGQHFLFSTRGYNYFILMQTLSLESISQVL